MRSKKSKKINGGDIKNIFGGIGQGTMATINMILLSVITFLFITNTIKHWQK